jgi:hypothetical protein
MPPECQIHATKLSHNYPRPNLIKHFTAVIYECLQQARVFVPRKPFQPSPMFASKA